MDDLTDLRAAAGVFRQLLHVLVPEAHSIDFRGIQVWFAACGSACIPVEGAVSHRREWCQSCRDRYRNENSRSCP